MSASETENNFAVLLAGGSGSRMRGAVRDKCLEPLGGLPVIAHSVKTFIDAGVVGGLVIVCRDGEQEREIAAAIAPILLTTPQLTVRFARGGEQRQDSVLNGLETCPANTALVFIHDSARPLIRPENLRALAAAAEHNNAAVLAHRVKDTIKRLSANDAPAPVPVPALCATMPSPAASAHTTPPALLEDLDRSLLWAMETPQVFRHALILDAYRCVRADNARITDDVAAAVRAGHKIALVENPFPNPKITDPTDLAWLTFLLR
jgi:2-C-methyl-D-erythritol 4-phosphate cytidylyltransferase